jgi:hypothetical protein
MSFTAWRTQNQEFVTVSPPSAVGHVRGDVQMHLQESPPQPRECYQNAQKVCAAVPSVNYVLGRVTIPGYGTIDHAWNSDEHGHFDVTLGGRGDFSQCVFQAIVTLTADQVNAMTWMGMPPTIYEVFQTLQSAAA